MKFGILIFLFFLFIPLALAQEQPASLILNGDFENKGFWTLTGSIKRVPRPEGGMCLEAENGGSAIQDIFADGLSGIFSVSCEMRAEDIVPGKGAGYAYVAVYQFDAQGELAAFHDFGQLTGTTQWRRFTWTFSLASHVATISLRCGIYNASGKAYFDNWTLVYGNRPLGIEEVRQPPYNSKPALPTAAIFREPSLPVIGAASRPERLGQLLQQAGFRVEYLSAQELADRQRLRPAHYHFVVLPYGQSFPAAARGAFTEYLHHGGSFISLGGYAFNRLFVHQAGQWKDEKELFAARLEEALKRSLIADGGFEAGGSIPIGGMALDGQWRRDSLNCTLVKEEPQEGQHCARVVIPPNGPDEQRFYLDLPPPAPSRLCRIRGWMRSENVTGPGYAYMAIYQYAGDKLIAHKDYGKARGTTPWTEYSYDVRLSPGVTRLHVKMGLYRAQGAAYFDNIRLSAIEQWRPLPMNTATGTPGDGLQVLPTQIGVFDASYPLRRVAQILPAPAQFLFPKAEPLRGSFAGWAAAGVQGYNNARWIALLEAQDRFGRPRGAAGAMMLHYRGYFANSIWAFFGVENKDLFDGKQPWLEQGFLNTARFIVRGLYLHNLETNFALYKAGEAVECRVFVRNQSLQPQACRVKFAIYPADKASIVWQETKLLNVAAGESTPVIASWKPPRFSSDLYVVQATLRDGTQSLDEMRTGFFTYAPAIIARGPKLRFHDNYLHVNGQPLFIFGSDAYYNAYKSACENPWTWHLDHVAARDFGFNLYENLQYVNPGWTYNEAEWRQFEAMAQSCQREGLIFMPCQLCGHNIAIADEPLEKQAALCKAYAQRMKPYPGLLYYLNGDFQFKIEEEKALTALWNQWLAEKYSTAEALQRAWGEEMYGEWGKQMYPPPNSRQWDSARTADLARFEIWLTQRWIQRHVQAIRAYDKEHPITSEYYQQPYGGLDLRLTIDGQDLANIGYFRPPEEDIDYLPLHLRLNDMRAVGKSMSLGEYGVKTHPAWTKENGAGGYHIVRTEEQQKELFMAVAHYAFAIGACKIQNWCLRDASENVFPWGVFYPNGHVPKDVAYWHRNMSIIWRFMRPRYVPASVTVLQPDSLRLGNQEDLAILAAFNSFRTLLALGVEFNVLNEQHIEALPEATKRLIWPAPFCPEEATFQHVFKYVQEGGQLLVTGDISFDADRKRTRLERLEALCGVRFVRALAPAPERGSQRQRASLGGKEIFLQPCVEVTATTAQQIAPNIYAHHVGQGDVIYCADPLEIGNYADVSATIQALYQHFLGETKKDEHCVALLPEDVPAYFLHQALQGGGQFHLAYPLEPLPGEKIRYPRFVATDGQGRILAASLPRINNVPSLCHAMALALDRQDLSRTQAMLIAPLSSGRLRVEAPVSSDKVVLIGDIHNGRWRTFEKHSKDTALVIDEDTMTCLWLVCRPEETSKWIALIEQACTQPWTIQGF